jgi:hypothetical protein
MEAVIGLNGAFRWKCLDLIRTVADDLFVILSRSGILIDNPLAAPFKIIATD